MKHFSKFSPAKAEITRLLGAARVRTDNVSLMLNSFDYSPCKSMPDAVLDIPNADILPEVIKILNKFNVPFVPRSAGTNHDGCVIALKGGVILNLTALNKIILIDSAKEYAVVEPAVVNQVLQNAVEPFDFFYAPDPASMAFSTLGGNASLNAGGAKTLKYGSTAANIIAAEIITPQGDLIKLSKNDAGPDIMSLIVRSEGTLGIIVKLWLKLTPKAKSLKTVLAYFKTIDDTMRAVRDIIAVGILPSALEAMDKTTMEATQTPYPGGMEALLICEFDGQKNNTASEAAKSAEICKKNNAFKIETASDEDERGALWAKRKSAAASFAKTAPNLISLDCALPREILPDTIIKIREIFKKYGVRAGMVFHAGDGNVHPNIAYDETNLYESDLVKKAVKEIHVLSVRAGGSISAEHGIGVEKRAAMSLMYDENALNIMRKIKNALDPKYLSNPDKVLPLAGANFVLSDDSRRYAQDLIERVKKNFRLARRATITGLNGKLKAKANDKNVISLSSLNQILDIDKINYTVTAQAGISLKNLAAQLAMHKMYLPIQAEHGSAGGVFASKTFDCFADYVSGLDFILPDGSFISIGGKYVKNSAGYDIIRLLHGSMGAYALITALTIRTSALPAPKMKRNAFKIFAPSPIGKVLKRSFDEKNLFNAFIFGDNDEFDRRA
ncbi:MAG: FAD-binding oxidoreductase [Elusimicrobiota bacterium]|nr:FAD-binding oxidoreductase [Elusimicrobiota bacterium]